MIYYIQDAEDIDTRSRMTVYGTHGIDDHDPFGGVSTRSGSVPASPAESPVLGYRGLPGSKVRFGGSPFHSRGVSWWGFGAPAFWVTEGAPKKGKGKKKRGKKRKERKKRKKKINQHDE